MRSRSTREGSVGLLILLGFLTLGGVIFWLKGAQFGRTSYQIKVDFPQASGVIVGSAVLFRGVQVGRVVSMTPKTNGIEAVLEISPADLRMPSELTIQPGRFGLIGEALVDINPKTLLTEDIGTMTAISPDCNSKIIVCDQDTLQGITTPELMSSLGKLAEIYGDPEFYNSLLGATDGLKEATERIISLTDEVSGLVVQMEGDLTRFSDNTTELSKSITRTSDNINNLVGELTVVGENVKDLIATNSDNITSTVSNINKTTEELSLLVQEIRPMVATIDTALTDADLAQLINNVEVLSANLREFSSQINSDSNLVVIQQTLDSARATFANAEKITADLDQLTGDPQFRNNVRRLVDGLSQLVSSTEQLEKNVQTAKVLNAVTEQVDEQLQILEQQSPPQPVLVKTVK